MSIYLGVVLKNEDANIYKKMTDVVNFGEGNCCEDLNA